MNHGCVTLDEVFAAAGARAASIVPETSGYLALAIGDATSRLPFAIDERWVMLTTEGSVGINKRGEILPPKQAAQGLRAILARLLGVSTGTAMPSLSNAGRAREESERGVDSVVEEIEAALIPVNRAAARRALARLARETIKAKESGRLKPPAARPEPKPAEPKPAEPKVDRIEATVPSTEAKAEPAEAKVEANVERVEAKAVTVEAKAVTVEATAVRVEARVERIEAPIEPRATKREEEPREPTPTVLGMGAMEVRERDADATATSPPVNIDPDPTALPESTVLAQPTEDPALAFDLDERLERAREMTPSSAIDVALRGLPEARPIPLPPAERRDHVDDAQLHAAVALAACSPQPRSGPPTRADDLLARFGASCVDDTGMRDAAACLRRIAGLETTPAPPVEISPPSRPRPRPTPVAAELSSDWDTPRAPRAEARRRSGTSLGLTFFVLLIGLAGGGALVHFRPDVLGTVLHPAAPERASAPSR